MEIDRCGKKSSPTEREVSHRDVSEGEPESFEGSSQNGAGENVENSETQIIDDGKRYLAHYGKNLDEQNTNLKNLIETQFVNTFPGLDKMKIHNYYICKQRNCMDISADDSKTQKKDNKFLHKWIFDPSLALCPHTKIWSLTYIDGKGMFCALCNMHKTKQPTNDFKTWNTEPSIRCRPATIKGHLNPPAGKSMHGDAVASEKAKIGSYFVEREKKVKESFNTVYKKVFEAIYWLAKEEISNVKIHSLLDLLQRLDVDDIELFQTRGKNSMRRMLIHIGDVLLADIVAKIKKSGAYGLLSDGVTDISNQHQNISFIKYYDEIIGDAATVFIDTCDLLAEGESEDVSADSETTFNSLVNLLNRVGLPLSDLKAMASDGASVMTGEKTGVGARFKKVEECKTLLTVHCICHRLALACGDTGDGLAFVNSFETTMLGLWTFFKNSPKRLKTYIKVALNYRNFSTLSKNQKKRIVRTVKKAVRTRWLSLHNSVDSVFVEYLGLVKALEKIGDATAIGHLKKIKKVDFLGKLYLFKFALPHLSALSKTFQTGAINYSKIKPNIAKTKSKLQKLKEEDAPHVKELEQDLRAGGRFSSLGMTFNENARNLMIGRTEAYVNSLCGNIDDRFPEDATDVLSAFDVFNVEKIPGDTSTQIFKVYGQAEMKVLGRHYHKDSPEKSKELLEQWEDFKFDLVNLKVKWQQFKENIEGNNMKLKVSPTEWALKYLMRNSGDSDYSLVMQIVKIAMVTPVSNAWPERGASAIKRVKSRLRSSMSDDMLCCLLMISMNGPEPGTDAAEDLLTRVVRSYEEKRRYKIPSKQSLIAPPSVDVGVQTVEEIDTSLKMMDDRSSAKYFDALELDNEEDDNEDDDYLDDDFESDDGDDIYDDFF